MLAICRNPAREPYQPGRRPPSRLSLL